ncbi:MAG: mannitol dehydrogenase family protein [Methylobacterium mesophilicum]|nr:mannitol dehydrogenase family protein [Methylobacterium mesophilicum]
MFTPIIQFGTSRFLQAHADLFIHEAREAGQEAGPVTVVAGSGATGNRGRLKAFNDPAGYPVIVRGLEDGRAVKRHVQVRSVARGIDAEADWEALKRIFVEEARFVISNTTETGFAVPDGLRVDLAGDLPAPPPSYPARLLALLAARHRAKMDGLVVLPTELVGRNGETLRGIVLALARASGASDRLVRFIADDCVFADSLVDRIVSTPLEPAGAVAEPYALWAVEAKEGLRLPCEHPAIQVVESLEPFERLKIHILNLGHTVLADWWLAHGRPEGLTVREILEDREAHARLDAIYGREVLPGFRAKGMGAEAEAYVATTLERFRNPFLDHRLSDIATHHAAKIGKRVGGFVSWVGGAAALPELEKLSSQSQGYVAA